MPLTVKPYAELKQCFEEKLLSYLKTRSPNGDIKALDKPRYGQVRFLQIYLEQLDRYTLKDTSSSKQLEVKARILTGVLYLIHDQIREEYVLLSSRYSALLRLLDETLGITNTTDFDEQIQVQLIDNALKFLKVLLCSEGDVKKPFLSQHPFSSLVEFDLPKFCRRAVEFKNEVELQYFDKQFAVKTASTDAKPATSVFAGISSFFGMTLADTSVSHGVPSSQTALSPTASSNSH